MSDTQAFASAENGVDAVLDVLRPVRTGRTIVLFDPDANAEDRRNILERGMERGSGISQMHIATSREMRERGRPVDMAAATVFEGLGLAFVEVENDERSASAMVHALSDTDGVVTARPEYFLYACDVWRDAAEATWAFKPWARLDRDMTARASKSRCSIQVSILGISTSTEGQFVSKTS